MKFADLTGTKGRDTGHRAIDGAVEYELCVSPHNYEVMLHYQNNWAPDLTAEIDLLLDDNGKLDEQHSQALYEKYFNSGKFNTEVAQTGARHNGTESRGDARGEDLRTTQTTEDKIAEEPNRKGAPPFPVRLFV